MRRCSPTHKCSALFVLKDLVGEQRDLIESTYYPISRFELSFYRNQVRQASMTRSLHLSLSAQDVPALTDSKL